MTAEVPTSSGSELSRPSSTRTVIIVVLAVVVLAGAAFVVYKLTNKRDTGESFQVVAHKVETALVHGDRATIEKYSTAQGIADLEKITKQDVSGLTFATCGPLLGVRTKGCTWVRPGGQLSLVLTVPDAKFLVSSAKIGPAGLAPTSPPTT